ncbi:MAG: carotenoid oxygenase family protein [Candidatus Binatia bacterium]|nr:carotenoid oxygenase family protein [Candidatus Binatia bacterium]
MTVRDPFTRSIDRRQFLRSMGAAASALALPPLLSGCGDSATSAADVAVPLQVDPSRPWWLQNGFGPVAAEVEAFDLPIVGSLPSELSGLFVRNGSNAQSGVSGHWFLGDGMLHGIRLDGGRASWYRNRYIETPLYTGGKSFTDGGPPIRGNNQSNVSAFYHGGKLMTSGEVGAPYEIDPRDLSTVGVNDFEGELNTSFTAHPKVDPATGNMHFFGYWFVPPYLTYHVADPSGRIIHSTEIELGANSMMHSFAITEQDVVFWDLPVLFDFDIAASGAGGFPFSWSDDYPARIGVMPLGGSADQIRWVEIEPCYVFHELNAYRDGDEIVLDVCRFDKMMDGERFGDTRQAFYRWRVNTAGESLSFRDEVLFERNLDFPVHDRRFTGRRNRHGWLTTFRPHPDTVNTGGVLHVDYQSGDLREWDPGPNRHLGEVFFVPEGSGEGEGWLLSYTYDHARDSSTFLVLDALNVERGPVAEIALPQLVPYGFHGVWVPDGA